MKNKEYSNLIFELTGLEGSYFEDFRVNRWGWGRSLITYRGQSDPRKKKILKFYVKVVGMKDKKSPQRNWGKFSTKKNI